MGGLITYMDVKWIVGFVTFCGSCHILTTELFAIKEGLQIVWGIIFPVFSSNMIILKLLIEPKIAHSDVNHPLYALIVECHVHRWE